MYFKCNLKVKQANINGEKVENMFEEEESDVEESEEEERPQPKVEQSSDVQETSQTPEHNAQVGSYH